VQHHGIVHVGDRVSGLVPAGAEVAVLAGRQREALVESPQRLERGPRQGEVVRGHQRHAPRRGVEVLVEVVDQLLAGGRVGILGEGIHGAARQQGARLAACRAVEGPEPVGLRAAVVVGEGQVGVLRFGGAAVAGRGGAGVLLAQRSQGEAPRQRGGDGGGGLGAAVVDHDHLEPVAGIVERGDRFEAAREPVGPRERGDDQREAGHDAAS
jgi:hypothetical protein